jgi:ATP adenylyltransferase
MRTSDGPARVCVFCALPAAQIVAENALAFAVRDIMPVTPLHTLVLPRRHVADYFDLLPEEKAAIETLLDEARRAIAAADPAIAGFNIAVNVGAASGQTIAHCHVHLVPRRSGDGACVILTGSDKRLVPAADRGR